MSSKIFKYFFLIVILAATGASASVYGAATIVIFNNDATGVGFNDTTAATPVGGNTGTTLGQQRLIAFQEAARIWGNTLTSNPTITVRAQWTALTCSSTSAVLGSAGSLQVFSDGPNFPFAGTWYGGSLANKLAGTDLDPATPEINANFNVNLGKTGCLDGSPFYLGLDGNEGTGVDLVAVLLHEFSHGLGFQTFTSSSTGAFFSGAPSVYDRFLIDGTSGKSWLQMTNAERTTSAINPRRLAWDGPRVLADVPNVLSLGTPTLIVNTPSTIAGNYEVGTAAFGSQLTASGITGNVVLALDPNDANGTSTTDGCSALTNASAVAGNIAVLDRGTCGFIVKVKNAQNAGATAVIIVDNAAGGPPAALGGTDATITIPSVRVTLSDGNIIKAQLGSGVNATLKLNNAQRSGADLFGKPLMNTPDPVQSGSSVSHWEPIAFPNQLMEPNINSDLTHIVVSPTDLTYSLFKDIGWETTALPNMISVSGGNSQSVRINQQFAVVPQVTINPAVAGITVTFTANSATNSASGYFSGTNSKTATAITDASGIATAPTFFANGLSGTYILNATAPGAGTVALSLSNTASLQGRIVTANGRGLRNARVVVTLPNGSQQSVITGSFGYYRFESIVGGQTVTVNVKSRRYTFQTQTTNLNSDTDLNLTANP